MMDLWRSHFLLPLPLQISFKLELSSLLVSVRDVLYREKKSAEGAVGYFETFGVVFEC